MLDYGDFQVSESAQEAKRQHAEQVKEMETQQLLRTLVGPTNDVIVRSGLRRLAEPVCFFDEGPGDRSFRLKTLVANYISTGVELPPEVASMFGQGPSDVSGNGTSSYMFQSEYVGGEPVIQLRHRIAESSLKLAARRLEEQRKFRSEMESTIESRSGIYMSMTDRLTKVKASASSIGGRRPLVALSVAGNGERVAVGSVDNVSLWKGTEELCSVEEEARISDLAFGPDYLAGVNFAGEVVLWGDGLVEKWRVKGHQGRAARLALHPLGDVFVSSGYDCTWRLWDAEQAKEILVQSGHCKEIYGVGIHREGSLLVTGDLGGICRMWDLRTGANVWDMKGHVKGVLSVDFSRDGFHVATGGLDNLAKVWDIRMKKCQYTLANHVNLVSEVRFGYGGPNSFPLDGDGEYLMTCSYDRTVKLWGLRDFTCVNTLIGHDDKVMRAEITEDGRNLVTVCYDRTWKLWN